jgi:predicted amidohydrolase
MALNGAHLILTPASLPINAEAYAYFFNRTIACENGLFIICANRIGRKRTFSLLAGVRLLAVQERFWQKLVKGLSKS